MDALRALSTLRGSRGAPEVPPLCRETQSLGQQMLELSCENATVGTNGIQIERVSDRDVSRHLFYLAYIRKNIYGKEKWACDKY